MDKAWDTLQYGGYYDCPISKYRYELKNLDNMNPNKLFNYILQNMETSNNMNILMDIHKVLRGKNTKIVLYTYDSFLLDYDKSEDDILPKISEIFTKYKLQIKTNTGNSYDFK